MWQRLLNLHSNRGGWLRLVLPKRKLKEIPICWDMGFLGDGAVSTSSPRSFISHLLPLRPEWQIPLAYRSAWNVVCTEFIANVPTLTLLSYPSRVPFLAAPKLFSAPSPATLPSVSFPPASKLPPSPGFHESDQNSRKCPGGRQARRLNTPMSRLRQRFLHHERVER